MSTRPFADMVNRMIRGELPPAPIAETIGMRCVEVRPDFAAFEMEASRRHANPMGTLHGGILCDVADAAMGMAFASALEEGESFTTLELKINFLRPVWNSTLRATARLVSGGRTVGMMECDVTDEQGRLVARASSTCMTLRGDKVSGREVGAG